MVLIVSPEPPTSPNWIPRLCCALLCLLQKSLRSDGGEEVGVTSVKDSQDTDTEELSGSGSQSDVGSLEVVDGSLGEHGVVLKLRLAQRWGVGGDEHQLGLAGSHALESRL